MATNDSMSGVSLQHQLHYQVVIAQVVVVTFLCINLLLIVTFFSKSFFYMTMRYVLFAVTLFSDTIILIITDLLLLFHVFRFTMRVAVCIIIYIFSVLYVFVTPITLTAMTLERYVAICMPLRHRELCSRRNTLHCVLLIHGLSSVPVICILSIFFAYTSHSMYTQYRGCSMNIFIFSQWQDNIKVALYQCYFFIMACTIIFSYAQIVKVALAASGGNKKSTWKGLRTVSLHGFQLLLCLIQLWCPFIETAVLKINLMLYINVRYFNYIIFYLAPRCLSPLIYGLRDEAFFLALKNNLLYPCVNKNVP